MKRFRFITALVLIVLGMALICFWRAAIRGNDRIGDGDRPATREELREQFPALAAATRVYGVDLFAPMDERESMAVVWRLNGQLWRPVFLSVIAVGLGLLLLTTCLPRTCPKWILMAARVALVGLIGLQTLAFVNSWLRRDYTPNVVSYPPETEPDDSSDSPPLPPHHSTIPSPIPPPKEPPHERP